MNIPHPILLPQSLGPYRLVRPLGHGGMATVYLAHRQQDYEQRVAIKVFAHGLHREDLLHRFHHERQILARLQHPNIARLLDGGATQTGLPYLVMEWVDGQPIDIFCRDRGLDIDARLALFRPLCDAVSYAHQNLVVHRDLKPSNILVTEDGVPKLLDFGIAKLLHDDVLGASTVDDLTGEGQRLWTPAYASPEQVQSAPITTASDVYSLGVLLYQLLTDHLPYGPSPHRIDLEHAVVHHEPQRASQTVADGAVSRQLQGDLDHILMHCLRKEADRRYGSVQQLADDVTRFRRGLPIQARGETLGYVTRRLMARYRGWVMTAAALLLTVVTFAALASVLAGQAADERDQARLERDRAHQVSAFLEEIFEAPSPNQARGQSLTALDLLDRGAQRLDGTLRQQPEVHASLAGTVARVYLEISAFEQAQEILDTALPLAQSRLSDDRPELHTLQHLRGRLAHTRGDLDGAETWLEQALQGRRSLGGLPLASTLNQLGIVAWKRQDLDTADALFHQALELRQEHAPSPSIEVGSSYNNIANLRRFQGDLDTAKTLQLEAIDIWNALGPNHPFLVLQKGNLAGLLVDEGDFDGALKLYREAYELGLDVLGEGHHDTIMALDGMSFAYHQMGRNAEAEPLHRKTIELERRLKGDQHLSVAYFLTYLGLIIFEDGRPGDAEPYVHQSLAILDGNGESSATALARKQLIRGLSLHVLGRIRGAEGNTSEALRLLQRAFELRTRAHGEVSAEVATVHLDLARVLSQRGRADRAAEHVERSVELRRQAQGRGHWRTLRGTLHAAEVLLDMGRVEAAQDLQGAVEPHLDAWPEDHPVVHGARQLALRLSSTPAAS